MNAERRGHSWRKSSGLWPAALLLGLVGDRGESARAQDATASPGVVVPPEGIRSPPTAGASGAMILGREPLGVAAMGTPSRYGSATRPTYGNFFDVALASIFGPSDYAPYRPLSLRTLFTEGWDEPWIAEPNDSGDAQQGWINAADGNFYRLYFFSYTFTNHLSQGGNGNTGAYTLYTPLSRRLELITSIPFITSQPTFGVGKQQFPNQGTTPRSTGHPTSAGFGDITFTPRVMLFDNDKLAISTQMSIQAPTGYRRVGAGQTILTPGAQFWWNFAENWVMRGGFNAGVGTNRQAGGTTLLSQYALGRTFTAHEVPVFGDLTFYLSTNIFNTVSSSQTTVTLTPGFRTHLGKDWYLLGGIDVPVTGRRPFEEGAIFWFMKTY